MLKKSYLNFSSDFSGQLGRKRINKKAKFNFKIHDVTIQDTSNYNTHMTSISKRKQNQAIIFGQLTQCKE